ncbi:MAG: hypothetical protein ALECFALPRED_002265 [Alectoria fallacina]|uniref:Heterokaryon incompatibility domain-containing protein n=1 Tax=Alectoria fallacina TaxID=1903189 RepID=A0A8H3FBH1_9LECA|nr:MAG: hypothetical protein ALECFALPRED_002265 [Alectoria fallacina]
MRCVCSTINFDKLDPRRVIPSSQRLGRADDLVFDLFCPLCNVIREVSRIRKDDQVSDDRRLRIAALHTSCIYGSPSSLSSALPISRKQETRETTSYVVYETKESENSDRPDGWEVARYARKFGWIGPVDNTEGGNTFHARILEPFVSMSLVKGWLGFCEKFHSSTCGKAVCSDEVHSLHMIECKSRIVVDVSGPTRYIALSYVWGGSECQSAVVLGDSARALPSKTASTIEDAIALTLALGVKYLWVDQFCIDQTNPQVKHQQIRHMDFIYQNAYLTIVAAAGHDADYGLPGITCRLRPPSVVAKINGQDFTSVPQLARSVIPYSTWNSRGWTYQESVMSSRLLILTNDEAYFECRSMNCSEAIHTPLTAVHIKSLQRLISWHSGGIIPSLAVSPFPFDDVHRCLSQFRQRSLKYPSDSLNAIQGVLNSLERIYPSLLHIWALPVVPDGTIEPMDPTRRIVRTSSRVEQLLTSLCWTTVERASRIKGLPSWSWVGWLGKLADTSPYEGYLLDSFGIEMYFQDSNTPESLIPLDLYCSIDKSRRKHIDGISKLLLKATMLNVKFVPRIVHRPGSALRDSDGFVLLGLDYDLFLNNRVLFTALAEEAGDTLADPKYQAIVLGERLHTYFFSSGTSKRKGVNAPFQPSLILLLVRKTKKGWKRIGLVIFENFMGPFVPETFMLDNGKKRPNVNSFENVKSLGARRAADYPSET